MINYTMFSVYNTNFFIKNLNLNLQEVKDSLFKFPEYLYRDISRIYIHSAGDLENGDIDSIYFDGIIQINSNSCKNIKSLMKLMIHELYHANEDKIKESFNKEYNLCIKEYLNKKRKILISLRNNKLIESPKAKYFKEYQYSSEFDKYLVNIVTYSVLFSKIEDILPSPYALTSIDEYIAVCFEIYLFENKKFLIDFCPAVNNLIEKVLN